MKRFEKSKRLFRFHFNVFILVPVSLSLGLPFLVAYMSRILHTRTLFQAALFIFTFIGLLILDPMLEETGWEHPAVVIKKSRAR